jgi:hypothetical protein
LRHRPVEGGGENDWWGWAMCRTKTSSHVARAHIA